MHQGGYQLAGWLLSATASQGYWLPFSHAWSLERAQVSAKTTILPVTAVVEVYEVAKKLRATKVEVLLVGRTVLAQGTCVQVLSPARPRSLWESLGK